VKATCDQILAAAKTEIRLSIKLLSAYQHRLYRQTGTKPHEVGAAINCLEFLLHGIMAGLITPAKAKTEAAKVEAISTKELIQ
jgi:hypothetical protein